MAYIARAIGAIAGSVPRCLPGRTAPPEGMAEWRREAAHQMVFGTTTCAPGFAHGDGKRSLLSNGANDCFSDCEGDAKSPVDLPLRLNDATASPTTPQGQHQ